MIRYIEEQRAKKTGSGIYWYAKHDIEPRIQWIQQQIEKLSNETN